MKLPGKNKKVFVDTPNKSIRDHGGKVSGVSHERGRVFVAMSGGVDSSVAALLLKNQGYEVVGVFMRCFNVDGCQDRDSEDARRVAEKLEIPFYVWDFEEEYKKKVVKYMVDGYRKGITPNPDVMCNREIKFGLFLSNALAAGADYVATGHYVKRVTYNVKRKNDTRYTLHAARDKNKDQSYFLWTLMQQQLAHCLFPIGEYEKPDVRAIARNAGLPTADKKDSQGICFLGKITIADFLKSYIRPKRGEILTTAGKKIGEHEGVYFYTIGQRHLGVNFQFPISNFQNKRKNHSDRKPFYVAEKDLETNTLVVAEGENNKALYKKEVELGDVNFIAGEFPGLIRANKRIRNNEIKVFARVRYRQPVSKATLYVPHPLTSSGFRLVFDKPQKFVAPGQSAVFYLRTGEMLGGGVII